MKNKMVNNLKIGDVIELPDELELTVNTEDGIIVFIEFDEETPDVLHLYIKSEDKSKNIHTDNRFEPYWRIVTVANK